VAPRADPLRVLDEHGAELAGARNGVSAVWKRRHTSLAASSGSCFSVDRALLARLIVEQIAHVRPQRLRAGGVPVSSE
jgi:hypothetical protein